MKRKIVFIVIFMLACLAPFATLWLSEDTSVAEKRELQKFPALIEDKAVNLAFFEQFDAWFSDHMGGRSYMIEAETCMKEKLFRESSESQIILGSDGWLYYAETADDFCSVHTLSERNIENVARSLRLVQDYCEKNGAQFLFTVAPNKNTLYPEHMPSWYIKVRDSSNIDLLSSALGRHGVTYVDLKTAFSNDGRVLYQPRDSHWTYEGGLLAYRTIVRAMEREHSLLNDVTFTERADWDADLVNMIYPNEPDTDIQTYPNIHYTFQTKEDAVYDEALVIESYGGEGDGTLLMFRDSFGNTTWRYFAQTFSKAEFQRAVPYRLNTVERIGADTVVLEIVERNIKQLAERAPLMEAPQVKLDFIDAYDMSDGSNRMIREAQGGFCHVYGTVDPLYLGRDYRVYMVVAGEEGNVFYEAFPIFEKELLKASETGDNGFSCYLPENCMNCPTVGILVKTEGKMFYTAVNPETVR